MLLCRVYVGYAQVLGHWLRVEVHREIMSKKLATVVICDNPLFSAYTAE